MLPGVYFIDYDLLCYSNRICYVERKRQENRDLLQSEVSRVVGMISEAEVMAEAVRADLSCEQVGEQQQRGRLQHVLSRFPHIGRSTIRRTFQRAGEEDGGTGGGR